MDRIEFLGRGGWRTFLTARGYVEAEGSHDSVEIYWAIRHGNPGTYRRDNLRLVNDAGEIIEGEGTEES